jgi:D-Tyr-tRNAtyr deacylase
VVDYQDLPDYDTGDEEGQMNLNIGQFSGEILLISQFTLPSTKRNRPSLLKPGCDSALKTILALEQSWAKY